MAYWAVVMTRINHERKALAHLNDQGFECYAPRYKKRKIVRGHVQFSYHYLFPNYLFIKVKDAWRSVLGTPGVSMLLKDGDKPARIPHKIIRMIKKQEDDTGFIPLEDFKTRKKWKRGQQLSVINGSMAGATVTFDEDVDESVVVLLNSMLFGQKVKIKLDARSVIAA